MNKIQLLLEDPVSRSKDEYKLVLEQSKQLLEKPDSLEEFALSVAQRVEDSRDEISKAEARAMQVSRQQLAIQTVH